MRWTAEEQKCHPLTPAATGLAAPCRLGTRGSSKQTGMREGAVRGPHTRDSCSSRRLQTRHLGMATRGSPAPGFNLDPKRAGPGCRSHSWRWLNFIPRESFCLCIFLCPGRTTPGFDRFLSLWPPSSVSARPLTCKVLPLSSDPENSLLTQEPAWEPDSPVSPTVQEGAVAPS